MALKHVNVVVVGAGAGGGIAAKELSEAGLREAVGLISGTMTMTSSSAREPLRSATRSDPMMRDTGA